MKIASLQYRYDFPKDFDTYREKIAKIVKDHADQGVELLLFPEYAGFEMHSFVSLEKWHDFLPPFLAFFQELSAQYDMYLCCNQVAPTPEGIFNRSYLFSPQKKRAHQDKCFLTPYEIQEELLSRGNILRLFETDLGKIGICTCYDAEFPPLVKKLVDAGAELILVPSYTSSVRGFYRVFLSCRARALENQCFVVQSALVGQTDVEIAYGAAAISTPVDEGFPEDGLLALGKRDQPSSIVAELDLTKLESVRTKGETHNYRDAQIFDESQISLEITHL